MFPACVGPVLGSAEKQRQMKALFHLAREAGRLTWRAVPPSSLGSIITTGTSLCLRVQ